MDLMEIRHKLINQPKKIQVVWNNAQPPFSTELYRPYNSDYTSLENVSDGVVKQTWIYKNGNSGGYQFTTRLIDSVPSVRTDHIYYLSYMANPSVDGMYFGVEFAGGVVSGTDAGNKLCPINTWTRLSFRAQGARNGSGIGYFGNRRAGTAGAVGIYVLLKSPIYVDLTQMFGAGNEPDIETFEKQCVINGIDLTQSYPQDLTGTTRWWTI